MASSDFLPDREAELRDWSVQFNLLIQQNPQLYSFSSEQSASYLARHLAYNDLFERARGDETRTPSILIAKNKAKRALIAEARELARIIRASPSVTDEQRSDLGLSLRDPGEEGETSRLPAPEMSPVLQIGQAEINRVKIRVRDKEHPKRRGRPRGVLGAMIFYSVGQFPAVDDSDWLFHSQSTRTKMELSFPGSLPPGTTVWIKARWINPRLQPGPFCAPLNAQLPGQLRGQLRAEESSSGEEVPPDMMIAA